MKKILLLLPDGFEFLEAAAFIDVFGWNLIAGDKSTELTCVGTEPVIKSSFGHSINADMLLDGVNIDDFDALALPGGFARFGYFDAQKNAQIIALIKAFAQADKPIAAVCTGSLLLAAGGILVGRHATTYQGEGGRWLEQLAGYGVKLSIDNPCLDGKIITSSDPASAPAVAFALLGMLTTERNAKQIKKEMGY